MKIPESRSNNLEIQTIDQSKFSNNYKFNDQSLGVFKDYFQIDTNNLIIPNSQLYIFILKNNLYFILYHKMGATLSDLLIKIIIF